MSLIDFSARTIPPHLIKEAGYDGVVVYVSESRPGSNFGANTPTTYAHQARFIHYTLATKPVNELVEAAD